MTDKIEAETLALLNEGRRAETWLQLPVRGSCSRLGAQAIRALTKENSDG